MLYLAGATAELDRARHWRDRLKQEAGIELLVDWIAACDREWQKYGGTSDAAVPPQVLHRYGVDTLEAIVRHCEVFWLLIPESPCFGAPAEYGIALATRVMTERERGRLLAPYIVLSGTGKTSIFGGLAQRYSRDEDAFDEIVMRDRELRA